MRKSWYRSATFTNCRCAPKIKNRFKDKDHLNVPNPLTSPPQGTTTLPLRPSSPLTHATAVTHSPAMHRTPIPRPTLSVPQFLATTGSSRASLQDPHDPPCYINPFPASTAPPATWNPYPPPLPRHANGGWRVSRAQELQGMAPRGRGHVGEPRLPSYFAGGFPCGT